MYWHPDLAQSVGRQVIIRSPQLPAAPDDIGVFGERNRLYPVAATYCTSSLTVMQPASDQTLQRIVTHILSDWLVFTIERTAQGYLVTAQYALPVWACPHCELINPRLRKRGTRAQTLSLPIRWLQVRTVRQRYQCQHCGVTFWEPIHFRIPGSH